MVDQNCCIEGRGVPGFRTVGGLREEFVALYVTEHIRIPECFSEASAL